MTINAVVCIIGPPLFSLKEYINAEVCVALAEKYQSTEKDLREHY